MPNVKFLLKRPKGKEKTLISLYARFEGKRLVYSTNLKIHPDHWDFKLQRPNKNAKGIRKNSIERRELEDIDIIISQHISAFNETFHEFRITGVIPSIEELKEKLNQRFGRLSNRNVNDNNPTLFEFIDLLVNESSKKPSTLQVYRSTKKHLLKFMNDTKNRVDFDSINLEFYEKLIVYLRNEGLSLNTIGKIIKTLKTFLYEATEIGINSNFAFKSKKFKVLTEETDSIYLNEDELKLILNHDFKDDIELDEVRDIFIVASYTGLRFSDLIQIKPENIENKAEKRFLKIKTNKTGKNITIPLSAQVETILNKRGGKLPKIPVNQKMNTFLKDIGEAVKINEEVVLRRTKGGINTNMSAKKFELISVHTARRSFATNAYLAGIKPISIMSVTGHKTERSFLRYIKVSDDEVAKKMSKHSFFNNSTE